MQTNAALSHHHPQSKKENIPMSTNLNTLLSVLNQTHMRRSKSTPPSSREPSPEPEVKAGQLLRSQSAPIQDQVSLIGDPISAYLRGNPNVRLTSPYILERMCKGKLFPEEQSALLKKAVDRASQDKQDKINTFNVLQQACFNLNRSVLMSLEKKPMNTETALTYAINRQNSDAIVALIEAGVDVNRSIWVNGKKMFPIQLAVSQAIDSGNKKPLIALLKGFPRLENLSAEQQKQLDQLAKLNKGLADCLEKLKLHEKINDGLQFSIDV
jgi:hypothetical protein